MIRRVVFIIWMTAMITGCFEPEDMVPGNREQEVDDSHVTAPETVKENVDGIMADGLSDSDHVWEEDETLVGEEPVLSVDEPLLFSVEEIGDDMAADMTGKSFHENPHIQISDLKVVRTGYHGFDGEDHQGAIVVNGAIAELVLEVFIELYDAQYPLEKLEPIDVYDGSDQASMVANNTSGFNYRVIAGTDRLSNHAFGFAIDINPLLNPWVTSSGRVYPVEGTVYADRSKAVQGMIKKGDACYVAFTSRGFTWGGEWHSSKDYQHFEIDPDRLRED